MGLSRRTFTREFKLSAIQRRARPRSGSQPQYLASLAKRAPGRSGQCLAGKWERALAREPDCAVGAQGGQQSLEIDFLKGCLQRMEQQRRLQALSGKPRCTNRSKATGKQAH